MDKKLTDLYVSRVLLVENTEEKHDETDLSNPEEASEVAIGKKILELITKCETTDTSYKSTLDAIKVEAEKLLKMHKAE